MGDRSRDVMAVQTLRNYTMAATFMASTSALLVVGTLTCTGGTNAVGTSTFTPTAGQRVSCTITNTRIADISVTKSATPTTVTPGGNVTWTIVVANAGPSTALAVKLVDALPSQLTLLSYVAPSSWDCSATVKGLPGTLSCTKPDMFPGESWSFSLTTSVGAAAAGTSIANTAVVSTTTTEVTTTNNQDSAAINVEQVVVLPPTGGQARQLVEIAITLIAAGAAMLALRRRRIA